MVDEPVGEWGQRQQMCGTAKGNKEREGMLFSWEGSKYVFGSFNFA
jgi:hypothetical protein